MGRHDYQVLLIVRILAGGSKFGKLCKTTKLYTPCDAILHYTGAY